jgi:hypothetical protein
MIPSIPNISSKAWIWVGDDDSSGFTAGDTVRLNRDEELLTEDTPRKVFMLLGIKYML